MNWEERGLAGCDRASYRFEVVSHAWPLEWGLRRSLLQTNGSRHVGYYAAASQRSAFSILSLVTQCHIFVSDVFRFPTISVFRLIALHSPVPCTI